MRATIPLVLPLLLAVAMPATAQSYRPVRIDSPNALEFFIVRIDFFQGLARTLRDRYAKVATSEAFGPHPIGRSISLNRQSNYAVMPVCQSEMLRQRTLISANRPRAEIRCP